MFVKPKFSFCALHKPLPSNKGESYATAGSARRGVKGPLIFSSVQLSVRSFHRLFFYLRQLEGLYPLGNWRGVDRCWDWLHWVCSTASCWWHQGNPCFPVKFEIAAAQLLLQVKKGITHCVQVHESATSLNLGSAGMAHKKTM